jgi:hypothetical protein
MLEQISLALPPQAGTHWLEQALPDERTVAELAGLNRDFLTLAGERGAARPGMPALGLPGHLIVGIARAAVATGPRLRLPFALFDLRFRDSRFWQSQAASATSVHDGPAAAAVETRTLHFARAVLAFSWHLVQRDGTAARLVLGLDSGTEAVIAGLPVGSLDGMARRTAPSLAARFCTRERFWELLVESPSGQAATRERDLRMSLLGQQLQGMDAARARQLHRRA